MGVLGNLDRTLDGIIAGPSFINNVVLAAGVAETITAPDGATHVNFSATGPYFVRWDGGAAAVPGADIIDGTGSEVNPAFRAIKRSTTAVPTTFSIVAPAACVVSMSFFRI